MKAIQTINSAKQKQAFTLIEMIGVLAVIAILAALLIPKVTTAISDSRVNATVGTYQTVQTAAASHYAKYNAFNLTTNGVTIPAGSLTTYDTSVLIPEGFLDQPASVKVGTNSILQVVAGGGNNGTGYKLDGTNNLTAANAYTMELVVQGVSPQDAYDVASRLDGSLINPFTVNQNLTGGRVVWSTNGTAPYSMYMYVAGR